MTRRSTGGTNGQIAGGGIDEQALEDWASPPSSSYVIITPDDEELEEIFEKILEKKRRVCYNDLMLKK